MTESEERSESGNPIRRYGPREKKFEPADGADPECLEKLSAHIEKNVGPIGTVYHEIVSDLIHLDVHHVPPTLPRPYHVLVTTGMSDRPMKVPEGAEEVRHVELSLCLPPEWPLTEEAFQEERHYWPVRWLKQLARFPHEYDTWLGWGHTMPNGDPPEPLGPGTKFCGVLLLPSLVLGRSMDVCEIGPEKRVHFLAVWPLYREEMDFKLKRGAEALLERFAKHGVRDLVEIARRNTCPRFLGLW